MAYFALGREPIPHLKYLPDFYMSSSEEAFRLSEEALHSKVGTVSLVKQMSALKPGQDNVCLLHVFCTLPSAANSLPAEAISAPNQSRIACAFDILQRVRCCCWPQRVTALPRSTSTGSSQLRRGHLPHLGFLLLSLTNIAIVSGNHTVGVAFSG